MSTLWATDAKHVPSIIQIHGLIMASKCFLILSHYGRTLSYVVYKVG